ncbi:MAG: RNA-binding protein [Oscillatoriales cyanobacterium RM1_1_9]|nr:RNA-binding protein [Oscillatoriales cyanobacterium SM2_3_0]NJO71942.1 RNA-binding protein [Oscillatoriales cyanobacterium RM1_1_9]
METENYIGQGKTWLEKLLDLGGVSTDVEVSQVDESVWLTIHHLDLNPEQISLLTGANGEVLDAMQYLLNAVMNLGKDGEEKAAYTVELGGYRAQRYQELEDLAQNAAKQVQQTGVELEIKSLSSVERRLIHNFLKDNQEIETYSRGQEPDRRLVIKTKDDQA